MTVFAVYSLIVLIVPCLGDMRGEHNISGSRKVIQSHTRHHSATLCMRGRLERLACFIIRYILEKPENVEMQVGASGVTLRGHSLR